MATLADVGLACFPFEVVPPAGPTEQWADRRSLRLDLERLMESWQRKSTSGIYLLWADLGAGKTHALRYLQARTALSEPPSLSVYCDLPESTANFLELYRQLVPQIPEEILSQSVAAFRGKFGSAWLSQPILQGDRETPQVVWTLAEMGSHLQGDVARRWLRGDKLTAHDSTYINNIPAIKTSERAIRTLGTLCRIILETQPYCRLLLMFDEFQRIGTVSRKKIQDINAGINTIYNSCPQRLAIILTYSFGVPEHIRFMVTDEVWSRVERQFQLPYLSRNDAIEFAQERIAQCLNLTTYVRPFSQGAIEYLVDRLLGSSGSRLTPRLLMQGFSQVLEAALDSEKLPDIPVTEKSAAKLFVSPLQQQN